VNIQSDSLGLAGTVTTILRDLIHERLGLRYETDQFERLADRLAPLLVARGLGSFIDYYYLLKYSESAEEWGRVMDALAVPETFFWREIDQVRAVVNEVIPALARDHAPLRIWSVPCASGEEPLTIAMMLEEAGWFDRTKIEILASDASPAAIQRARAGRYGPRAFRNLPERLREKYFTAEGERTWAVAPALAARVGYDVVNLMDAAAFTAHAAPIVFCRNVFIYFSDRSIRRVVDALTRSMPGPGVLCIGAAESLLRIAPEFELVEIGGAFVYTRRADPVRASPFAVAVRSGEI